MKAKITPRKEMVLLYRPEQADAQENRDGKNKRGVIQ